MPLKRTVTGESILEGGKDKNAAWKLIIMSTVSIDIVDLRNMADVVPGLPSVQQNDSGAERALAEDIRARLAKTCFDTSSRKWSLAR